MIIEDLGLLSTVGISTGLRDKSIFLNGVALIMRVKILLKKKYERKTTIKARKKVLGRFGLGLLSRHTAPPCLKL